MLPFSFWQKWLFVLSLLIIAFGVGMALLSGTAIFQIFNSQINPVFWGASEVSGPARNFQKWVYGLLGATMAGWGVFFAFIVHYPFRRHERWAWNCIAAGLLLWYVIDTSLSVAFNVVFNVVFNTALLVFALLPLVFTRRDFNQSPTP
jgi:hypothetical protein